MGCDVRRVGARKGVRRAVRVRRFSACQLEELTIVPWAPRSFHGPVASTPDALQAASNFVSILGLVIAVGGFVWDRHRERRERELNAFATLDDKYIDFLRLCLDYPQLDVLAVPLDSPGSLTDDQLRKEYALFAILISLFESVSVMLEGQSAAYRGRFQPGWEDCMKSYAKRAGFRRAWAIVGPQCDRRFYEYMQGLIGPT